MNRALLALAALLATAPASACGGNGQTPCTTSPATYLRNINCDGGSFRDPRNGGECWSCDGWNRTANAVTAGNACSQAGYTSTRAASRVKNTAWAWDCKSGTFWDAWDGGACWSCGGWDRTGNHINSNAACSHAYPEQTKAARYVKANSCGSGEFSDPRNGGECWTCPSGYDRTAAAVTAADACVARQRCAAGSIEYAGACWTKGACGAKDGRPCTVGERLPSCDEGLKESAGRCIPLEPGESPFLAGLGEAAKNVSKDGEKACDAAFAALPKLNTGNRFLDAEGACSKAQMTGFLCAATQLPAKVGGAADLIAKVSVEYGRDPCKALGILAPHRALCSTVMAMGRDMGDAFECLTQATAGGAFKAVPLETLCRLEGELGFELALMAAGGAVAESGAAAGEGGAAAQESGILLKVARALLKADGALGKADDANEFADKMKDMAACRRMAGGSAGGQRAAAAKASAGLPFAGAPSATASGDLVFYRVDPQGNFTVAGRKVGNGWGVGTVVPGAGNITYIVAPNGDLSMYRHDADGNYLGAAKKIGNGWGDGQTVLSAAPGVLLVVKTDGTLWVYKHDDAGTFTYTAQIGSGWGGFKKILAGGDGIVYAIAANGDLLYYVHDAAANRWSTSGLKIGNGWTVDPVVIAGGQGTLYTVAEDGAMYLYHHRPDGRFVTERQKIGSGWTQLFGTKIAAVPDGSGAIYGVAR